MIIGRCREKGSELKLLREGGDDVISGSWHKFQLVQQLVLWYK